MKKAYKIEAMSYAVHIIDRMLGGIRPAARVLGEAPSTVSSWKKAGRIPATKHDPVLRKVRVAGFALEPKHFFDAYWENPEAFDAAIGGGVRECRRRGVSSSKGASHMTDRDLFGNLVADGAREPRPPIAACLACDRFREDRERRLDPLSTVERRGR